MEQQGALAELVLDEAVLNGQGSLPWQAFHMQVTREEVLNSMC
jgi:hypothetical protein